MTKYFDTIGDGSQGFVANGPLTIQGGWLATTSTVVRVNGTEVDMTASPVGERQFIDGFELVRTERGLKARSTSR
jgi:hypothetical protein